MRQLATQAKALSQDLAQEMRLCVCEALVVPLATAVSCDHAGFTLLEDVIELTQVLSNSINI